MTKKLGKKKSAGRGAGADAFNYVNTQMRFMILYQAKYVNANPVKNMVVGRISWGLPQTPENGENAKIMPPKPRSKLFTPFDFFIS